MTCKFIHPHGTTNNFHWLCTDDAGYVPFNKFIMTVETPQSSSNGKQFLIKEIKHTNRAFENLIYFSNHMRIYTTLQGTPI